MKKAHENRIQGVGKGLEKAGEAAGKAQAAAAQTQGTQPGAPAENAPVATPAASQSAFNPALSLILVGRYANFSQDPAQRSMTGFLSKGNTSDALGPRGFSLGETEVTMSA